MGILIFFFSIVLGEDLTTPVQNEHDRKKQVLKNDPILRIDVYEYLMSKLNEISKTLGQEKMNLLMNTVDPSVLEQLKKYPQQKKLTK